MSMAANAFLYHNMVSRRTRHERENTHEPVSAAGLKAMAKEADAKGGGREWRRTRMETRCGAGGGR